MKKVSFQTLKNKYFSITDMQTSICNAGSRFTNTNKCYKNNDLDKLSRIKNCKSLNDGWTVKWPRQA